MPQEILFRLPSGSPSHCAFDVVFVLFKGGKNSILALGNYWIRENLPGKKFCSITTTYASTGSGYVVPSAAAKAGILAITRSLAVEWAKYQIRFNTISAFPTKGAWDRSFPEAIAKRFDFTINSFGTHWRAPRVSQFGLLRNVRLFIDMTGEELIIDGGEWLKGAGEFNFLDMISQPEWDELENCPRR